MKQPKGLQQLDEGTCERPPVYRAAPLARCLHPNACLWPLHRTQYAGRRCAHARRPAAAACRDLHTGTALTSFKGNACPPGGLARLGRDYLVAAQLGRGGGLHFWAWHKDQLHQRCFAAEPLTAVAASPDGAYCAAGGASGAVFVWEASSGRLLRTWSAHYKARGRRVLL